MFSSRLRFDYGTEERSPSALREVIIGNKKATALKGAVAKKTQKEDL